MQSSCSPRLFLAAFICCITLELSLQAALQTEEGGATNYYASCLANYLLHMQTQKITCTKRRCTNNFGMREALVSAGGLLGGCSAVSRQASS